METLTFGQAAVGLKFNPSDLSSVDFIKSKCAELLDLINEHNTGTPSYTTSTIKGEAIRTLMTAQMWAVKYLTWKDPNAIDTSNDIDVNYKKPQTN